MSYERIQPFPNQEDFEFPELHALSSVWKEKKSELESNGAFLEFNKKLQREWAIETGIIERLYTWDRGVTEILIEQGIESSIISHKGGIPRDEAEHIQDVINDHLGIVEGLFSYIKGEEPISEYFIRNLQAQFTAHQDYTEAVTSAGNIIKVALKKGEYKTLPNNPRRDDSVHEYCPPEFTKEEMESLVSLYREAEDKYTPELKSAWLHHRFTQIHPFQDGNGRVARAIASIVFLKAGLFPLVIRESDRQEYIGALEEADSGNLFPLVSLFAKRQREAILKAIGLEQQVQQSKHADQIIFSALQILKNKFSREKENISKVYKYADQLFTIADSKLHDMANSLDSELRKVTPPSAQEKYQARANSANNKSEQRHYFQKQIVAIANKFDYFANFDNQRAWSRMSITTEKTFDYVLSFHGYGPGDSGLLAISAFTYLKAPREEGGTEPVNLHPASIDLFQFNYVESYESTEKRFNDWLESSLAIALAEWKKTI